MTNNLNLNILDHKAKSQLVKLPYEKRQEYCNLIDKNLDKFATIIVRPLKPIKQTVKLNEKHKTMVNAGWIQSITIVQESDLVDIGDGNLVHKLDVKHIKK